MKTIVASNGCEAMTRAASRTTATPDASRSEEHTSELQSPYELGCRLLLEKKKLSGTRIRAPRDTQEHPTDDVRQRHDSELSRGLGGFGCGSGRGLGLVLRGRQ